MDNLHKIFKIGNFYGVCDSKGKVLLLGKTRQECEDKFINILADDAKKQIKNQKSNYISDYKRENKSPYVYNSKNVKDGTVEKVRKLKSEGLTFSKIAEITGKSRQRVSQIYYKSIANQES